MTPTEASDLSPGDEVRLEGDGKLYTVVCVVGSSVHVAREILRVEPERVKLVFKHRVTN